MGEVLVAARLIELYIAVNDRLSFVDVDHIVIFKTSSWGPCASFVSAFSSKALADGQLP